MTEIYAAIAVGTAASLTALTLVLLRVTSHGTRPVLTLARRWSLTSNRASFAILLPIGAIAVYSFASIPARIWSPNAALPIAAADRETWDQLRAYADTIGGENKPAAGQTFGDAVELPAVDVMVAKLIGRLKDDPNNVAGWKMLAWTFLNTNRPSEAVEAYETALKLAPGDAEVEKALQAARSANAGTESASASQPAGSASDPAHGEDAMVRGMVERLATRLESAPNDEGGWQQLIRSRMVLGEKDAAATALSKAIAAFASDNAAQDRLIANARFLGLEHKSTP